MDHPWLRRATEMKYIPSQPSPKSRVCTPELNSALNSSCWIVSPSWHTFGLSTKHYMILAWVSLLGGPWIIPADSLLMATLFWRYENLITQMKTALCLWPQDPQNIPKHIFIYVTWPKLLVLQDYGPQSAWSPSVTGGYFGLKQLLYLFLCKSNEDKMISLWKKFPPIAISLKHLWLPKKWQ